ncbi:MAG: DUF2145 domain-containing protein [Oceanospirillaceae bacterium]|nr:DUF2145 domain-containing protein [Oceanospirillaceae bacterium]
MKNLFTSLLLILCLPAFAGSQSHKKSNYSTEQIVKFSKQVENYAAKQGARAFIIGRIGRDPKKLPKGIKFTHTAIALYSNITLDNGKQVKGYAIHNLYQREGQANKSDLAIDYPVDFFWGAKRLTAGITIPTAAVQQRLIDAINNGVGAKVHIPNYSVISNPMNKQFQNCTEHTLLVLNAAIYQTTDLDRLYENNNNYFKAQKVRISPLKLLLGSAFVKGVTTRDHKSAIKTTTYTSIAKYLKDYGLLHKSVILDIDGNVNQHI